jgi:serine/threonine-protein kinase RsbW
MTMSRAHRGREPVPRLAQARHVAEPAGGEGLLSALPSWARAFPGTPRHASAARQFVAGLLEGSPLCDDAVVVLCELFTNAVLHTDSGKPGGLVIVQVSRWRLGVRIAVTDQGSPSQPIICGPAACGEPAESGNGLYLAAHLAGRLNWHDDASGRTIAAILGRLPPEQHPRRPATWPGESSRLPQPVTCGA